MSSEITPGDRANLEALAGATDGTLIPVLNADTTTARAPLGAPVGSTQVSFPTLFLLRSLARAMLAVLARLESLERGRS